MSPLLALVGARLGTQAWLWVTGGRTGGEMGKCIAQLSVGAKRCVQDLRCLWTSRGGVGGGRRCAKGPEGLSPGSIRGLREGLAAGWSRRVLCEPFPSQCSCLSGQGPCGETLSLTSSWALVLGLEYMCANTVCPQGLAQHRTRVTAQKMWNGCMLMASRPHNRSSLLWKCNQVSPL